MKIGKYVHEQKNRVREQGKELVITIDTEEDNWARYSVSQNPLRNIEKIPMLQKLFDEFGFRPTYLITYQVATDKNSVALLKKILDEGKCEIGSHCHPWNTPPYNPNEQITDSDTMLFNLPADLVDDKLSNLHDAVTRNFGKSPVSFRAGRWGFGPQVAKSLCRLGYKVDTSVSPYIDWQKFLGPDYSDFTPELFRFGENGLLKKIPDGLLLQVPATIGFLQNNFAGCQKVTRFLDGRLMRKTHLKGFLYKLGLLNKIWLSPEGSNAEQMIKLTGKMEGNGYKVLNMCFHSTSLLGGLTPFVANSSEEKKFIDNIAQYLFFAKNNGWKSKTLSEVDDGIKGTCETSSCAVST